MSDYTLYLGDCLEYMKGMDTGSVDAIITDLPYGTTACSWDEIIPFVSMWEGVKRILKPRGAFVTTASQPFTSKLIMSNLDWFRDEWIWEKDRATRHLDSERRPLKAHENIEVFGKELPLYNPIKTNGHNPANKQGKTLGNLPDLLRGGLIPSTKYGQRDRYPRSIIKCYVVNGDERGLHPTQKPVALYSYLIQTYTNPDAIVFDMCMGSGTTGVAALQLGRRFMGCEIDPGYFAIAEKRIKQAAAQMLLPLEVKA